MPILVVKKIVSVSKRFWQDLRPVWRPLSVGLACLVPNLWGSANIQAKDEIRRLKRRNRWARREPIPFYDRLTNLADHALPWLVVSLLMALCGHWALANIKPWVFFNPFTMTGTLMPDYPILQTCTMSDTTKCPNGDNYHALLGTIQATVLGLLIPIAISAYELMAKERHLQDEMKDFVMKEARVDLIVRSSISLLIWLAAAELFKVNTPGARLAIYTNIVEWVWVSLNLLMIVYFMSKILGLLSQSTFNQTMRRFILRRAYEGEMTSKIASLRYRNLTRSDRDDS
ncbi:hypothetical protein ATDW_25750 [Asticcacaulis sp. DW145]|uniref:hypothetical protein n=1 Tax=Asticcacaulis sp. DW145 TaxID=3095608 RepID=UPI00308B6ED3|nr:hypothetical protein ATDW_25750 [Asticcacaulis sp. DW145]